MWGRVPSVALPLAVVLFLVGVTASCSVDRFEEPEGGSGVQDVQHVQDAWAIQGPVVEYARNAQEWADDVVRRTGEPLLWATFDSLPSQDPISPKAFQSQLGGSNERAAEYDDTAVVEDPHGAGKVIRTTLDPDTIRGVPEGNHGIVIFSSLDRVVDEACISYDIRFGPGFDFDKGGKLPGLLGVRPGASPAVPSGGGNPGDEGWSARAMWLGPEAHDDATRPGSGVSYLYGPEMSSHYGDELPWGRAYTPGRWHKVKHCQKMNTVGRADGVEQAYFDGQLVAEDTEYVFRLRPDVGINNLAWSIFRGGGDLTWASDEGGHVDIDNVLITETPNLEPMADFRARVHDRTVALDGLGHDVDGTIESFAWDFGDGATGSGTDLTHTYRDAGIYQVTLTVTDSEGATAMVTKQVAVGSPGASPAPLLRDTFTRAVADGWGSTQGTASWRLTGGDGNFDVANGRGDISVKAGEGPKATTSEVLPDNTDTRASFAADKIPDSGSLYLALTSRTSEDGNSGYRAKVRVRPDGSLSLSLVKAVGGSETVLAASEGVSGLTLDRQGRADGTGSDDFVVRLQTEGSSPTTVRAKVWRANTLEPPWMLKASDSTGALQERARAGLWTYLSGSTGNGPIGVSADNLLITPLL